ncbi:MAG: hypothetical protein MJ236_06715 [Clostridia bacterium]|nr:hypothetical protein [Clostridia bacterium]
MYVSVNKKNEIKEVGVSTNPSLTSLYIDDEENPFEGWSEAKICCYKVHIKDGIVMMMTPYVDSRLLEHFDQIGIATEINAENIDGNSDAILETYETGIETAETVAALEDAVLEVYELLVESEE